MKACILNGIVEISSAKNATLPILVATILCPYEVKINGISDLMDVGTILKLVQSLGVKVDRRKNDYVPDASK